MQNWIYFIEHAGRIKIGTSANPKSRIAGLGSHYQEPLVFLGCVPGDRSIEKLLHTELAAHRLRGEWFTANDEVRRRIGALLYDHAFRKSEPVAPSTPPPTKDKLKFGRVIRALWPNKPALNLAQRIRCSERAAQFYIDGERKPSAQCIGAIVAEILN